MVNALALRGRVPAVGSLDVGRFNPAAGQNALLAGQQAGRQQAQEARQQAQFGQQSRLNELKISDAERTRNEALLDRVGGAILGAGDDEAAYNAAVSNIEQRQGLEPGSISSKFPFGNRQALIGEIQGAKAILAATAKGRITPLQQNRLDLRRREVEAKELEAGIAPPSGADPGGGTRQVSQVAQPRPVETPELSPQSLASRRRISATLTPGEKKLDQEFAKDVREFSAAGGFADVTKSLGQLEGVAKRLEGGEEELTGAFTGPLSQVPVAGSLFAGGAIAAREAVEEVVQRNLRSVLGGQFAQQEAAQLISRAFNPNLDERENARRIRRLITQIRTASKAKAEAVQYFQRNGTLRGFQGRVPSFADFDITGADEDEAQAPTRQRKGDVEAAPATGRNVLEGAGPQPNPLAINRLRGAPTDANIVSFNRTFGDGAAERVLGVQ